MRYVLAKLQRLGADKFEVARPRGHELYRGRARKKDPRFPAENFRRLLAGRRGISFEGPAGTKRPLSQRNRSSERSKRARLATYLAAIDIFHGGLPEEEVDEVSLGHGADEVRRCN